MLDYLIHKENKTYVFESWVEDDKKSIDLGFACVSGNFTYSDYWIEDNMFDYSHDIWEKSEKINKSVTMGFSAQNTNLLGLKEVPELRDQFKSWIEYHLTRFDKVTFTPMDWKRSLSTGYLLRKIKFSGNVTYSVIRNKAEDNVIFEFKLKD